MHTSTQNANKRQDIQLLRGWAVLIVVIDHANFGVMPSGFLGVDIFFVISGFLITGIISRGLNRGDFSFGEFYFRRARRLLPAAFATILLAGGLAIFSATSTEIESLIAQILGALTYTINFVLWQQVDYFGADANLKPLLHMWSLAVEEQFYILLPILMFLCGAKFRSTMIWLITFASFMFCMFLVRTDPSGAFYMLPTRAWELGIGAILAVTLPRISDAKTYLTALYFPALIVLITLPFLPFNYTHPGWAAAAICLATAGVIAGAREGLALSFPGRVMSRIGDMSYSLYLVHWPIMVFVYSGFIGDVPKWIAGITIPASLLCAWLMYRFVELPGMRLFPKKQWSQLITVPVATVLVGIVGVGLVHLAKPEAKIAALRAPNYGLAQTCDFSGKRFKPQQECRTSDNADTFIWGDSYAMHLVKGIAETRQVEQATFSACAPIVGYAQKRGLMKNYEKWADLCLHFNEDVLAYLATNSDIKTVVLSSPWRGEVSGGYIALSRAVEGDGLVEHETGLDFTKLNLTKTISKIQAMGKDVIVYGPPPWAGRDISSCLERVATKKVLFDSKCSIEAGPAKRYDANVHALLDHVETLDGVQSRDLSNAMCDEESCATQSEGISLYRDAGHLSEFGSLQVFKLPGVSF